MIPDRYIAFLELVAECKNVSERKIVLKALCRDKKFMKLIHMICRNTVRNLVPLSSKDKARLQKHADVICLLAESDSNADGRRLLVQDGGGFISVLLPIVTALIGAAINGANSK